MLLNRRDFADRRQGVAAEVESVLLSNKHSGEKGSFREFAGMMFNEEVSSIEKTIDESCETIHPDDWK
jgi:hypothetical protein